MPVFGHRLSVLVAESKMPTAHYLGEGLNRLSSLHWYFDNRQVGVDEYAIQQTHAAGRNVSCRRQEGITYRA